MNDLKTYENTAESGKAEWFRVSTMESIYDARNGETDEPHRHNYYTILITSESEGEHVIDFNSFKLEDQTAFFVYPGQVHQVIERKRSTGFVMTFNELFLEKNAISKQLIQDLYLIESYDESPGLKLEDDVFNRIRLYCSEMLDIKTSAQPFKDEMCGALLKLILIACRSSCSLAPASDDSSSSTGLLRRFKNLLESHFTKRHDVAYYAEELHLTTDNLNRKLKDFTGKTTKQHIQARIITAAKRELKFTTKSAKEIAYLLGFSEQPHFSSFFKKCTGISPTDFREQ